MATLKSANDKPTPEMLLALSDFVAGLHECQLGSQWALVGEAAQDLTIRRGQILVMIPNESDADSRSDLQPEMILAAGPLGMRIGGFRLVNAEASAQR